MLSKNRDSSMLVVTNDIYVIDSGYVARRFVKLKLHRIPHFC